MYGEQVRHSSIGTTNSSRYKKDPILQKNYLSTSDNSVSLQNNDIKINNDENYLMPKNNQSNILYSGICSLVGNSIHEDSKNEENINAYLANKSVKGRYLNTIFI